MSKVIKVELSEDSIENAIREVQSYKQSIQRKCELLREKVAESIRKEAQSGFNSSVVDDIVKGGTTRNAQVTVSTTSSGDTTLVIADGEDAIWVEFGAGVFHNGSVGQSPNPYGTEHGFTIGSYGKGNGRKSAWGYYDEDGNLVITHGTPATMPLARAVGTTLNNIVSIAKEVFQ